MWLDHETSCRDFLDLVFGCLTNGRYPDVCESACQEWFYLSEKDVRIILPVQNAAKLFYGHTRYRVSEIDLLKPYGGMTYYLNLENA